MTYDDETGDLTVNEKIQLIERALWRASEEKLDIIAAVIDL